MVVMQLYSVTWCVRWHPISHARPQFTSPYTHRPEVELHFAVGVVLHYGRPRLTALDAAGGTVELLAAELWSQRGLEDVLAVDLLELDVSPAQTQTQTHAVTVPESPFKIFLLLLKLDLFWGPPSLLFRPNGHW